MKKKNLISVFGAYTKIAKIFCITRQHATKVEEWAGIEYATLLKPALEVRAKQFDEDYNKLKESIEKIENEHSKSDSE